MNRILLSAVLMMFGMICYGQKVVVMIGDSSYSFPILAGDKMVLEPAPPPPQFVVETELASVNLGLSSGTKWANMNVGASSNIEFGYYFMWGHTEDCSNKYCNEWNCKTWGDGSINTSWNGNPEYDAATKNWGSEWQTPTIEQIEELINECSWEWTSLSDVEGCKVTGPNGYIIFLPATCMRRRNAIKDCGFGFYWSSTPNYHNEYVGLDFYFSNYSLLDDGFTERRDGLTIRPVLAK